MRWLSLVIFLLEADFFFFPHLKSADFRRDRQAPRHGRWRDCNAADARFFQPNGLTPSPLYRLCGRKFLLRKSDPPPRGLSGSSCSPSDRRIGTPTVRTSLTFRAQPVYGATTPRRFLACPFSLTFSPVTPPRRSLEFSSV